MSLSFGNPPRSRDRYGLLLSALLVLGCGGGRSGDSQAANSLSLSLLPLPPLQAQSTERGLIGLALRLESPTADKRLTGFAIGVDLAGIGQRPWPFRGLRLAWDRDGSRRYEPGVDLDLGAFDVDIAKRTASITLDLLVSKGSPMTVLVVGNLRPISMGMDFHLELLPTTVRVPLGQGLRRVASASTGWRGPALSVIDADFASDFLLGGGGSSAALRFTGDPQITKILFSGNPATHLQREAKGLYSFLLPPLTPGRIRIRAIDATAGSIQMGTIRASANAGSGPARFLDVSLTHLPRDHGFSQDAEVADMDGDGDPDLLIPAYSGQKDRLYLNDGQGRFVDVSATHVPDLRAESVHWEPCDVDGDGDVDIAIAVEGGQNRLYLNDGQGRLSDVTDQPSRMPRDQDFSEDIQAGDLDGDGDMDLVAANLVDSKDPRKGGQIRIYINDGKGFFRDGTQGGIPIRATRTYDVNLADLDGDGDLDIFAANYGEVCRAYRNDGQGRFVELTLSSSSSTLDKGFHTSAEIGDLDGDGDLDIFVGTFQGQSLLYRNQGRSGFIEDKISLPQLSMSTYDVALGDLDGDGDLDAILANTSNPSKLLLNDGKGRFAFAAKGEFLTPDDKAYDVQFLDADGDGALDVFISAWGDRQDTLYLSRSKRPPTSETRVTRVEPNWGPPTGGTWVTLRGQGFTKGMKAQIGARDLWGFTVTDATLASGAAPAGIAGDADLRLVLPGGKAVGVAKAFGYETPPKGAFQDVTTAVLGTEPRSTASVDAGDLDGDGLPDIVFADAELGARIRLSRAQGPMRKGSFAKISASANEVELAHLDGDKKLDLILVDAGGAPWIFPGKGDGSFLKPIRLAGPSSGAQEVAVGDLDADGDLDLVFAWSGKDIVYLNGGKFRFTQLAQAGIPSKDSRGLALGDVDGDGDLDLAVAHFLLPPALYLNNGKGVFKELAKAIPGQKGDQSYSIALADVDSDGDLDAAVANGGAQVNRLFLNGGKGSFVEAPIGVFKAALGGGSHVVFADVDLDGDPDLFSAHFWGNNHLYFYGDLRLAEKSGMLPSSPGGYAGAVFSDLDQDGDPDLILAGFWGGCRVLRNPRK